MELVRKLIVHAHKIEEKDKLADSRISGRKQVTFSSLEFLRPFREESVNYSEQFQASYFSYTTQPRWPIFACITDSIILRWSIHRKKIWLTHANLIDAVGSEFSFQHFLFSHGINEISTFPVCLSDCFVSETPERFWKKLVLICVIYPPPKVIIIRNNDT